MPAPRFRLGWVDEAAVVAGLGTGFLPWLAPTEGVVDVSAAEGLGLGLVTEILSGPPSSSIMSIASMAPARGGERKRRQEQSARRQTEVRNDGKGHL